MFSLYALIISLAYTQAIAVKILGPTSGSTWTSPGPNTIKWVNETYDPITFNIQLAHNNSTAFIPSLALPIDGIFATGVHITARMMVYVPSCAAGSPRLPTGEGFTIRFLQEARDGSETVIATSEPFNVTEVDATLCLPVNATFSVPGTAGASTSIASIGDLSLPHTASHLPAIIGSTIGALSFLIIFGCIFMWTRRERQERKRKTTEFGMKIRKAVWDGEGEVVLIDDES